MNEFARKLRLHQLALFGGTPAFEHNIPVGQLYFPSWNRYTAAMRGIFERQYYSNHGPLVQHLEAKLSAFLGVRHVICVTNATIGLIMATQALELTGKVIVPAFTFIATAQSLSWGGLEPVFCDVDPTTHHITPEFIRPLAKDPSISAILAVNLWGGACQSRLLEACAKDYGLALYFDSAHAFGCRSAEQPLGGFGRLEVFSFHATKVLNATEGGCVCTNDDDLAARLRNIRSSYGAGEPRSVPLTVNGRMSEAQAAIALDSLEQFPAILRQNQERFMQYQRLINSVPGLHVIEPAQVSTSNYQYLVCQVDKPEFGLSRDQLLQILKAENLNVRRYFYPGIHRSHPYHQLFPQYVEALPHTDYLAQTLIQFPIGALVTADTVDRTGELLEIIHRHAAAIRRQWHGALCE